MTDMAGRLPIVVGVGRFVVGHAGGAVGGARGCRRQAPLVLVLVHACAVIPAPVPPGVTLPQSFHEAMLDEGTQWLTAPSRRP
jgi:hypothetical protein